MTKTTASVAVALASTIALATPRLARAADRDLYPGADFAAAINAAQPGDRILLHTGVYTGGGWIQTSGTAAAPITLLAADGPRTAVIDGGTEALRVGGASAYLTFDGLEVRNAGNNDIHIDGGSHDIIIRNVYAHDAGPDGDCLKVNQADHITVENSEFARPGAYPPPSANPYQQGTDFLDVNDSAIRDSYYHDCGSQLLFVKGGSTNVVIERNTFSDQHAGASDPMVGIGSPSDPSLLGSNQYEAINVVFRNNILMNGLVGALGVYDANGAYIVDNLFLDNDRVIVEFRAGDGPAGGSTNVQFVNNLVVDTRGQMPTNFLLSSHTLSNLSAADNLYWNNNSAVPASSVFNVPTQAGYLVANPLVTAPGALDPRATIIATARPAQGSPAQGSGADVSGAPFSVTDDITAATRANPRDRGPYALSATNSGTPAPASGSTPPPSTGSKVATVSYTVSPTSGTAGSPATITASSTGSSAPVYRFWLVTPDGHYSEPCGDYAARATCTFTPPTVGAWQLAVSARDAGSTAQYDATTNEQPFPVDSLTCPPERTTTDDAGQPRNAAGRVRYCWPGQALCDCDAQNDCYAQPAYVPCTAACPPEATTPDSRGQPRDAAGHVRYCWPGQALCDCDQDWDCYAQPAYVPCSNSGGAAGAGTVPGGAATAGGAATGGGCSVRGGDPARGLLAALGLAGAAGAVARRRRARRTPT